MVRGHIVAGLSRAANTIDDHALGLFRADPVHDGDPLALLQVLVVLEEVRNLLRQNDRQVQVALHARIERVQLVHGHGDDFFIGTGLVFHEQRADRAATNDGARYHRHLTHHHHVHGVTVTRKRVRNKTVVPRVVHGGVQEAVHAEHAAVLV